MKTFIIDNQLKVGTEKPKGVDFAFMGDCHKLYKKALKYHEESLMNVENVRQSDLSFIPAFKDRFYITTVINDVDYEQIITSGQQVEIEKTDKGCRITKIL